MPADDRPATDGLRRELSLFDTIAVVVGACVGVGIVFKPSRVVGLAGSSDAAMLAWCSVVWSRSPAR